MLPEVIILLLTQGLKTVDNLPDDIKTRLFNDMLDDKEKWDRFWDKLLGEK